MRAITALLLLCVSAFSFASPAEKPQSNGNDQLAQLLFNDPNSPRTGERAKTHNRLVYRLQLSLLQTV